MTDVVPPLAVLLPVLFLGGIVSTVAGGGLGILLTIASTFFTDVRTSVILVSLLGFVIQGVKILYFRRYARWDIIRWYLLAGVPLSFAGGWLLFLLPQRLIEVSLALLCMGFCAAELRPFKARMVPSIRTLVGLGAVNGLVGGMVGQGALLRSPALLAFGLTKEQFIGTSSVIALCMNIGKTSAYLTAFTWTPDAVILLLSAVPAVLAGVHLGRRLLRYVEPIVFERILLGVVFLGAIRLLLFP